MLYKKNIVNFLKSDVPGSLGGVVIRAPGHVSNFLKSAAKFVAKPITVPAKLVVDFGGGVLGHIKKTQDPRLLFEGEGQIKKLQKDIAKRVEAYEEEDKKKTKGGEWNSIDGSAWRQFKAVVSGVVSGPIKGGGKLAASKVATSLVPDALKPMLEPVIGKIENKETPEELFKENPKTGIQNINYDFFQNKGKWNLLVTYFDITAAKPVKLIVGLGSLGIGSFLMFLAPPITTIIGCALMVVSVQKSLGIIASVPEDIIGAIYSQIVYGFGSGDLTKISITDSDGNLTKEARMAVGLEGAASQVPLPDNDLKPNLSIINNTFENIINNTSIVTTEAIDINKLPDLNGLSEVDSDPNFFTNKVISGKQSGSDIRKS